MIGRAEAACDRYRHAAEQEGVSLPRMTSRRVALQTMEGILTRLRTQKATADRPSNPGAV